MCGLCSQSELFLVIQCIASRSVGFHSKTKSLDAGWEDKTVVSFVSCPSLA